MTTKVLNKTAFNEIVILTQTVSFPEPRPSCFCSWTEPNRDHNVDASLNEYMLQQWFVVVFEGVRSDVRVILQGVDNRRICVDVCHYVIKCGGPVGWNALKIMEVNGSEAIVL